MLKRKKASVTMVKKEIKEDSGPWGYFGFRWPGRCLEKGHVSELFWIFETQSLIGLPWRLATLGSGKGIADCDAPLLYITCKLLPSPFTTADSVHHLGTTTPSSLCLTPPL